HRDAVDEAATGLEHLLDVPLGRLLGADRQVRDDDVGSRVLEDLDDVGRLARRLLDPLREVLAEAVVRHAAVDRHVEVRHVGELDRVVLAGPDRLGEVLADLLLVDVEGGRELHVADVVAAEVDVHEAGHSAVRVGVLVVLDALHERVGAVADADDGNAHLLVLVAAGAVARSLGHGWKFLLERSGGKTPPAVAGYSSAPRESSRRTWKMRWKTVIVDRTASTYTAGASSSKSPRPAPFANTKPIDRITTRTARLAIPTLHSTPSASARARV